MTTSDTSAPIDSPRLSAEHLDLLVAAIRHVVRARRLTAEDAQDFAQTVHLKLLERDYDVFRRFDGRSSMRTFLTVVIERQFLDWLRARRGKWRSSATASRLGSHAISLDRLIHRDGYSPDQAVQALAAGHAAPDAATLQQLADRLPRRVPHRLVPCEGLGDVLGVPFDDPIERVQRRRDAQRVHRALLAALRELPAEDRRVISARYRHHKTVRAIAIELHTDPRKLYGQCDRILRSLRKRLLALGVTGASTIGAASFAGRRPQPVR